MSSERQLFLADALGFCNGVRRALDIVEQALASGKTPLYVLHEIVHNNFVVDGLRKKGVIFVDDPAEVPDGAFMVLSAHGTAPAVREQAGERLHIIDATCPLVRKVQQAAVLAEKAGERIVLLGHPGHPEVTGILGHCSPGAIELVNGAGDWEKLAADDGRTVCLLSQTTLNADDVSAAGKVLSGRFARVRNGAEVCYATRDRQDAVRKLAEEVEYMIILGSAHSSNSRRLQEAAQRKNIPARLVDLPEDISAEELAGVGRLGLSAGASVPDELIARTVEYLKNLGFPLAQ